jgi:hypothetical protein
MSELSARSSHIFQIYYSEETKRMLDPGFLPLNNIDSTQPEWREYSPMRNFLLNAELDEQRFYGFFAPKFFAKTNLDSSQVFSFIDQDTSPDIITFSPFCDQQALFLNCFTQGEFYAPGLMKTVDQFFDKIGLHVDLQHFVMDSRSMVFCNYFVAKPAFWRAWLDINERLYALSEPSGDLYEGLNALTDYHGSKIPLKVFIMERMVSFLLATGSSWTARAYDPFAMSISAHFAQHLHASILCDALKIAFRTQGHEEYMTKYLELLNQYSIPQPQK